MSFIVAWIFLAIAIVVPFLAVAHARRSALRFKYRPLKNSAISNERVVNNSPKYKKLVGLLNGDREAADRLSDTFGVDRAISDLLRDRQR